MDAAFEACSQCGGPRVTPRGAIVCCRPEGKPTSQQPSTWPAANSPSATPAKPASSPLPPRWSCPLITLSRLQGTREARTSASSCTALQYVPNHLPQDHPARDLFAITANPLPGVHFGASNRTTARAHLPSYIEKISTDYEKVFTDASVRSDGLSASAAFFCPSTDIRRLFEIPHPSSSVTAELAAIDVALKYVQEGLPASKVVILTDSRGALSTLTCKETDSPILSSIMESINNILSREGQTSDAAGEGRRLMFRQHAPAWAEQPQRRILDFQCFGAPAVFPRMRAPCSSRGDGLECVASPLQFPRLAPREDTGRGTEYRTVAGAGCGAYPGTLDNKASRTSEHIKLTSAPALTTTSRGRSL
ncbi:hypothetical protein HPB51_007665 [Rhipicephalus microplus]|uniref:Tick transposon n=1 Tax=Rhipicephalus microplus TaxID=6941 RepID=A0A9J6D8Q4_RHIMP|nr:hypothetical protein HPB51_007665 [Rhipicephalus microplus]